MIVYLHGFNSSPLSAKARMLVEYCARGNVDCAAPKLHHSPARVVAQIKKLVADGGRHTLVGSSMGGYYAAWFCENFDNCRAVLINPAVKLADKLRDRVGETQRNYYCDEEYLFTENHINEFRQLETAPPCRAQKYLLLLQTGDEVLDYREAAAFFAGAELVVEEGGDHSFAGFENHLARIVDFAESGAKMD